MDMLDRIMSERAADVAAARRAVPEEKLRARGADRRHRSLVSRLKDHGTCIVAEMKQASPSAGMLRPDYRPVEIAVAYEKAGAGGLSVLTEPHYFLGSGSHLEAVRAAVSLPILRKDFMCDPYQVLEAAAWGADVILLILAALDDDRTRELVAAAAEMKLEVLAEAHTETEVERALAIDDAIVGVNSRNLKTLKTDLDVARRLIAQVPSNRLAIAESGITRRAEVTELEALGYRGFLIGESLLSAPSPGAKLRELLGR